MTLHAACSPSSAAMWLACPASVTLTRDLTRPSSRYAREGTAAHAVAEMILRGDIFLPDKVKVENQEFIVSPGMCRDVRPYIEHIHQFLVDTPLVMVEQRVVIKRTFKMVWGTIDCGVILPGQAHVVDLKYGRGVAVQPDSPQLKLYGLGLVEGFYNRVASDYPVTLTVCQPRVPRDEGPLRSHATTIGALREWRSREVVPAIERIRAGVTSEHPGHWCRWCVRRAECAAFNARHQSHAKEAFDDADA